MSHRVLLFPTFGRSSGVLTLHRKLALALSVSKQTAGMLDVLWMLQINMIVEVHKVVQLHDIEDDVGILLHDVANLGTAGRGTFL